MLIQLKVFGRALKKAYKRRRKSYSNLWKLFHSLEWEAHSRTPECI